MRRIELILLTFLLLFLLPLFAAAEEITIVGTGSGPPILKEIGKIFSQLNPGITITVPPSIGSSGGIKAVGTDENLIARVARPLKENEQHYNLEYTQIARVPIVFYVHPSVKVKDLTIQQVLGIYTGEIFSWQQAGGLAKRIRVIRRQEGDSSLKILREQFPGFNEISITGTARTTFSDPETIALTEATPDAIAFGSFADVKNRDVSVLNIDSMAPTDDAYPYFGPFALVYKEKNMTGPLKKFIEFATSPEAAPAIKSAGGLPLIR